MNVFEQKHTVSIEDIDKYNHVNNVVYVQWMQNIADAHWKELSKNAENIDYVWFIVRHEIDYKNQAVLNDEIILKTWVGKTAGIKSVRHFEMYKEETLLVKSQTTFCLLDATTKKPKRITKEVINLLLP